ncbi:MAG TPA: RNA polymerase sigma factor [Clostridia bacterium]|nr:RNA polymerase sigma factor [Clostridia bacterium]
MEAVADRELFAQLMAESERPVYAFLASKVRDRTIASDISQEAFFLAYRRFDSYDRSRPFLPWVMTIAYNCLVDYWRKLAHEGGDLPDEQLLAAPEQDRDDEWKQQEIVEAMTRVSPDESALLTMFYAEGSSLATIGVQLGVAEGTAKVRLFRARAALKKQVEALHERGAS